MEQLLKWIKANQTMIGLVATVMLGLIIVSSIGGNYKPVKTPEETTPYHNSTDYLKQTTPQDYQTNTPQQTKPSINNATTPEYTTTEYIEMGTTPEETQHEHLFLIDKAVDPTCTSTGLTQGKHCVTCGEIFVAQEIIPTLKHQYRNATCTLCNYTVDHSQYFKFAPLQTGGYAIAGLSSRSDCPSELIIPPTYNGLPVTTIQPGAGIMPPSNNTITSIIIPESVTKIEPQAFYSYRALKEITIPNSVKSIGYNAFQYCNALKNVYIDDIASWCAIDFENHLSNPLSSAQNLYCANTLASTSITIPSSVTSINDFAFYNFKSLVHVTVPATLTNIGEYAFANCSNLVDFPVSHKTTFIGACAFSGCSSLPENITIPSSVKTIDYLAFDDCTSLVRVTISNGTTSIGYEAFSGCINLTNVTLPSSLVSIGTSMFANCDSLFSITFSGTSSQWNSIKFPYNALNGATWDTRSSIVQIICTNTTIWL